MSFEIDKQMINHPSLTQADEMAAICRPLAQLKINYFSHVRVSNEKRYSVLSSNPSFLEHYLNQHYYDADINMAGSEQLGRYVLWDALDLCGVSEKMNQEAVEFGLEHSFTIVKPGSGATEYFHFSSDLLGPSINNEYLRHLELLEKFTQYFKETINGTPLNKAHHANFQFNVETTRFSMLVNIANVNESARSFFLSELGKEKKSSLCAHITKRQRACLDLYVKGYTTKHIASQLGLSRRTVENYLQQVKDKLCVSTKSELILLALENNIF